MKTKLLFAAALFFISLTVNSQVTLIPDPIFEARLVADGHDSDGTVNGQILTVDAEAVTYLNVSGYGISDLSGIEDFINLTILYVTNNQLTSLDLSSNTLLEDLYCTFNNLTSLTLPNTSTLEDVWCHDNSSLASLDVTGNSGLKWLATFKCNLSSLDLTNNTQLEVLRARENNLSTIDVTQNINLIELSLSTNNINTIDLSQNTNLNSLGVSYNPLGVLNVNQNTQLVTLGARDCDLNVMNVTNNALLEIVDVGENQLSFLNLSNNPNLNYVVFHNMISLQGVNIQNGNNTNIPGGSFWSTGSTNLSCIQVDDPTWSNNNWNNVDGGTVFSLDCNFLDIEENNIAEIKTYPNPTSDVLNVFVKDNYDYVLYNLNGQIMSKGKLQRGDNQLNLKNVSENLLMLNIFNDYSDVVKKIIKD